MVSSIRLLIQDPDHREIFETNQEPSNKAKLKDKVNWHKVDIILEEKSGIAEDITS